MGVFSGRGVPTAKNMVVDRKHQKALALLYLMSGPLPNAVALKQCADQVRRRTL